MEPVAAAGLAPPRDWCAVVADHPAGDRDAGRDRRPVAAARDGAARAAPPYVAPDPARVGGGRQPGRDAVRAVAATWCEPDRRGAAAETRLARRTRRTDQSAACADYRRGRRPGGAADPAG